jgi:hypothetical protein
LENRKRVTTFAVPKRGVRRVEVIKELREA